MSDGRPLIIAHRGASGYLPEHTLPAYALAIFQGADYIEPDLVISRDGVLIARHDNRLDLTTDVASHSAFVRRKTTKVVDGQAITGWFSEDFSLAEIRQLRAIERIPEVRPGNQRFDGQFGIPTLAEILQLVQALQPLTGRRIGLYPEIKHPSYFAGIGLAMEQPLIQALHAAGYHRATDPVFIQCFEIASLKQLRQLTELRLMQLLWSSGQPYDIQQAGQALSYAQMATAAGLRAIAEYADAVGPEKNHFILPLDSQQRLVAANATSLVADAHAAGLLVHPFTFRAENAFLPDSLQSAAELSAPGDWRAELKVFLGLGIDGLFTDHPDKALAVLQAGQTG